MVFLHGLEKRLLEAIDHLSQKIFMTQLLIISENEYMKKQCH
jgi:hypothetical protein